MVRCAALVAIVVACGAPPVVPREPGPQPVRSGHADPVVALVAANALGRLPAELTGEPGDTSPLAAATFLAQLTGAPIDPKVAIEGELELDGTIAPADASDKPASDIYQAYKRLTGRELPATAPVEPADMALDATFLAGIELAHKSWQSKLAGLWATIVELDTAGRLPPLLAALRDYTKKLAAAAESLRKRGRPVGAYAREIAAWTYATATTQTYDVLAKVQAGDVPAAIAALGAPDDLHATFDAIGTLHATTVEGELQILAAYSTAVSTTGYREHATRLLAEAKAFLDSLAGKSRAELGSVEVGDQLVAHVGPALLFAARTRSGAQLAADEIVLEAPHGSAAVRDAGRVAAGFAPMAPAAQGYLDRLVIAPAAKTAQISIDDAHTQFASFEPEYAIATGALTVEIPAGADTAMLVLARSGVAYGGATRLLARYHAIGVHTDGIGTVTGFDHARTFAAMLASAERTARVTAGVARAAAGAIPVQTRLAYQLALDERDGELADQVDALGELWDAALSARIAVALAGVR